MDLNQTVIAVLLGGFFLIALIRVFRTPLRLALKLLCNTLLGFLLLRLCRPDGDYEAHHSTDEE